MNLHQPPSATIKLHPQLISLIIHQQPITIQDQQLITAPNSHTIHGGPGQAGLPSSPCPQRGGTFRPPTRVRAAPGVVGLVAGNMVFRGMLPIYSMVGFHKFFHVFLWVFHGIWSERIWIIIQKIWMGYPCNLDGIWSKPCIDNTNIHYNTS